MVVSIMSSFNLVCKCGTKTVTDESLIERECSICKVYYSKAVNTKHYERKN